MSLKTWLVGLGLFGITNGAAAQNTQQQTENKKSNTAEAVAAVSSKEAEDARISRYTRAILNYRLNDDDASQEEPDGQTMTNQAYQQSGTGNSEINENGSSGLKLTRLNHFGDDDTTEDKEYSKNTLSAVHSKQTKVSHKYKQKHSAAKVETKLPPVKRFQDDYANRLER